MCVCVCGYVGGASQVGGAPYHLLTTGIGKGGRKEGGGDEGGRKGGMREGEVYQRL